MEDPLYREIILDHWQHPQNYGTIADASFTVEDANPACGDHMRLSGKITDGALTDIAFTAQGCAICVASASLFTEKVKNMAVADIRKLSESDALDELGIDISPARTKCALLVYSTVQKAL